jgi:Skp family chaperone for outer membrane proteins
VERVLEQHEDMIDKHEDKLEKIQTDLTDIKVRLGIKDKTNGQVLAYQQQLIDENQKEIENRKEQDALLLALMEKLNDRVDKVDERIWYIATGVLISIMLEIGIAIMF